MNLESTRNELLSEVALRFFDYYIETGFTLANDINLTKRKSFSRNLNATSKLELLSWPSGVYHRTNFGAKLTYDRLKILGGEQRGKSTWHWSFVEVV
jgi:hypothetical protein